MKDFDSPHSLAPAPSIYLTYLMPKVYPAAAQCDIPSLIVDLVDQCTCQKRQLFPRHP